MYGLMFEVFEDWVIKNHGREIWQTIKNKANCNVKDHEFLRRSYYTDEEYLDIFDAASDVLGMWIPDILEEIGHFVAHHHYENGYEDLLKCLGSDLRQWLSNLNAMHDHIEKTFEDPEKFESPIFWCEDCDTVKGSILLHYYSLRGVFFVPLVVGVVEEVASFQFEVEVNMERLTLQGENGAKFTTWRIKAVDKNQRWKLSPLTEHGNCRLDLENLESVNFDNIKIPNQCPFSRRPLVPKSTDNSCMTPASSSEKHEVINLNKTKTPDVCPYSGKAIDPTYNSTATSATSATSSSNLIKNDVVLCDEQPGLTLREMQAIFPFHVLVDGSFTILQVGNNLPGLLELDTDSMCGKQISDFLDISRPVLGSAWDWKALQKLADQHFFIVAKKNKKELHCPQKKVSIADDCCIKFKAAIIRISQKRVMFVLSPDARNVEDLNSMGLTLSDLPLSSCQRDAVFLSEYITQEMKKAHDLDKLSRKLNKEKRLSNTLLYNMLPKSVADTLRDGHAVEPKLYENVTVFFSDIVGFTSICDQVDPCEVIVMLNQLYTVMDHLASHFDLYKVETIGDAYMCCSGLPTPDDFHAENIADFAIAVRECVRHVKSPLDGSSLQLRIGIHTGRCTAGVVGTLTPHYCLFGDMVNTTSRHESTGVAGKVQCSSQLFGRLMHFSANEKEQYKFTPRGLVQMKGKSDCYTYWLDGGTQDNTRVNQSNLNKISEDVREMLANKTWTMKRYFRSDLTSNSSVSDVDTDSNIASDDVYRETNEDDFKITDRIEIDVDSGVNKHSEVISRHIEVDIDADFNKRPDVKVLENDSNIGLDDYMKSSTCTTVDSVEHYIKSSTCTTEDSVEHVLYAKQIIQNDTECSDSLIDSSWSQVSMGQCGTNESLIVKVHQHLLSILKLCVFDAPENIVKLDIQLYDFIVRILSHSCYMNKVPYHNFERVCSVAFLASYLAERAEVLMDDSRWNQFVLVFTSLVHGISRCNEASGDLNNASRSDDECCPFSSHIPQESPAVEPKSFQCCLDILADEFPELYDALTWGCPHFLRLSQKVSLAMDNFKDNINLILEKFKRTMQATADRKVNARKLFERAEASMELLIVFADIGHYAQQYDTFLKWNRADFEERKMAYMLRGIKCDHYCHPRVRIHWFRNQIEYFHDLVLPVAEQVDRLTMPRCCQSLKQETEANLRKWEREGRNWTQLLLARPPPVVGADIEYYFFE